MYVHKAVRMIIILSVASYLASCMTGVSMCITMDMMNKLNFVARTDCESCAVRRVTDDGGNLVGIVMVDHEFHVTAEILQLRRLLGSQLAIKQEPSRREQSS